eukprot:gene2-biopygen6692
MVTGMPMKDENYDIAVNLLKKRFGKQELIQQAHISHLLGLHPVYNDKAVSRLRNLHDEIETHYRGLEALGVNTSSFSAVVVPTLLEKLAQTGYGVLWMVKLNEGGQVNLWPSRLQWDGCCQAHYKVHENLLDNVTVNGERYSVGLPWKAGKNASRKWKSSDPTLNSEIKEETKSEEKHSLAEDSTYAKESLRGASAEEDLERVQNISLPRCLYDADSDKVRSVEIHAFGDASSKAYCGVVYLVYETPEGIKITLLCSKSRVAPLKEITIPRKLEGRPYQPPPTAQMPDFRVKESIPFANVGIDFAGPLYVKSQKQATKKNQKELTGNSTLRWKKEYLIDLRESHRMNKNNPANINAGDIVVVQDENLKRGQWKIAIVKNVSRGKDGHIRGAKVCKAGRSKALKHFAMASSKVPAISDGLIQDTISECLIQEALYEFRYYFAVLCYRLAGFVDRSIISVLYRAGLKVALQVIYVQVVGRLSDELASIWTNCLRNVR